MTEIKFNLNEYIKVKLTNIGYQHLANIHNDYSKHIPNWPFRTADYYKSLADGEGYTRMQMWEFLQYFGPLISMGMPNYFDLDIIICAK